MNNTILWEEKNSTEQEKNSLNCKEIVENDTIYEIKNDCKKNECKDTGLTRNCPKCDKIIKYSSTRWAKQAALGARSCKSCSKIGNSSRLGIPHTGEVKRKISFAGTGRIHSADSIEKIRLANIGKTVSEKTKEKLRIINTGKKASKETRKKLSDNLLGNQKRKGIKHTDEVKTKISQSLIGRMVGDKNPMFGKPGPMRGKTHSEDTIRKLSLAKIGKKMPELFRRQCVDRYIKRKLDTGKCVFPCYNEVGCQYFDWLNKWMGWNGQHATSGGEKIVLGYFLDYYEPTQNIVIEWDEKHHKYIKEKDIKRQKLIKDYLQCRFFRYDVLTKTLIEV